MLMHAIAHRDCMVTVRESALKFDWEKNALLHQGLKPASLLRLAFQPDVLPTELSLQYCLCKKYEVCTKTETISTCCSVRTVHEDPSCRALRCSHLVS